MRDHLQQAWDTVWQHLPTLAASLIVLVVGWITIRFVVQWGRGRLVGTNMDPTLVHFFSSALKFLLKVLLLLAVAGMLGVETTSFLAVLGAAGLAVGLALKDSLSHFASGILIIIFHPFRVGDLIDVPGTGPARVERITILYTYLRALDSRTIVVPNGALANTVVVNLTSNPLRRVDIPFGVAYSNNLGHIRNLMLSVARAQEHVLSDPEPFMTVDAWADSSVSVTLRVWCESKDYFTVYWALVEQVKNQFDAEGIEIPFPHQVTINKFTDTHPVFVKPN